jgi:hypothetical protein
MESRWRLRSGRWWVGCRWRVSASRAPSWRISTPSSEPISDFSVSVESKQAKYGGLHCLRHWYASWLLNKPEAGASVYLR